MSMPLPTEIRAIAGVFVLVGLYLVVIGLIMLVSPGRIGMAAGAPLLSGLELAGPYMFLLTGTVAALIAWGLLRVNNWARRAALLVALLGVVMLVPSVSGALISVQLGALARGGLGVVVRVIILWYLYQPTTTEAFHSAIRSQIPHHTRKLPRTIRLMARSSGRKPYQGNDKYQQQ